MAAGDKVHGELGQARDDGDEFQAVGGFGDVHLEAGGDRPDAVFGTSIGGQGDGGNGSAFGAGKARMARINA